MAVRLRRKQVSDFCLLQRKVNRTVRADRGQLLAEPCHIIMLAKRLPGPWRLHLIYMGIRIFNGTIGGNQARRRLLPNGRHAGNIV